MAIMLRHPSRAAAPRSLPRPATGLEINVPLIAAGRWFGNALSRRDIAGGVEPIRPVDAAHYHLVHAVAGLAVEVVATQRLVEPAHARPPRWVADVPGQPLHLQ